MKVMKDTDSYSSKLLDLILEVVESDVLPYLRGEKDRDQIIASRETSLRMSKNKCCECDCGLGLC